MELQRILVLAKPDAVQRGLIGEIIRRLEMKGLKMVGIKMMSVSSTVLKAHYAHIADKPFYSDIEKFMQSSPLVAMAWEGYDCVEAVRVLVGPTDAKTAQPGTIRGDYGLAVGRNLVHASDSAENGATEVSRFFEDDELFVYDKTEWIHVFENL